MGTTLSKLTKDIRFAAATLSIEEARYLVDLYYQMQEFRKATTNQCRALSGDAESHATLAWFARNFEFLEKEIKSALKKYVEAQPIGRWAMDIPGIGPVITAGLIANIDISKVQTAGQIFSFCGLNPKQQWEKGEKRPWNARLKRLCWLIGECFVKVSNRPQDIYGKYYKERKEYEQEMNEAGEYADQAKAKLERYKIGKDTEAYKWYIQGKLPPAHINARAKRYAVKLFLAHLFEVWYEMHNGCKPPLPYAIAHLNHAHKIDAPNWPKD